MAKSRDSDTYHNALLFFTPFFWEIRDHTQQSRSRMESSSSYPDPW
jgi:hypothetical protein